jgi:hypothetical protein
MRLILEKDEIVSILGKHFEVELDPETVIIRTDPFEIEMKGIPLSDAPPKETTNVVPIGTAPKRQASLPAQTPEEEKLAKDRDDPDASTEPPEPGDDGLGGIGTDIHPAAVLAASKELERQLDHENPQLKRRAGRGTSKAPDDFKNEIT